MPEALSYLRTAVLASLLQIGVFLVPGLVLTLLINFVSLFIQRRALGAMGRGWYLLLFGGLGTITHEVGHAIFCLIFRHKITRLKLFDPDPETGTLGYVEHTYNSRSIYQLAGNFFIGIGPVLLGTAATYLLIYLLLGVNFVNFVQHFSAASSIPYSRDILMPVSRNLLPAFGALFSEVFSWHNFGNWQLYAFIYLAVAIGSSIKLSPSDIKGAFKGLVVLLVLVFIFNLATIWAADFTLNIFVGSVTFFLVFYMAMSLILLLYVCVFVLFVIPLSLLSGHSGSPSRN
jgi:hypothetical protein